jgi:hypothetical protein
MLALLRTPILIGAVIATFMAVLRWAGRPRAFGLNPTVKYRLVIGNAVAATFLWLVWFSL